MKFEYYIFETVPQQAERLDEMRSIFDTTVDFKFYTVSRNKEKGLFEIVGLIEEDRFDILSDIRLSPDNTIWEETDASLEKCPRRGSHGFIWVKCCLPSRRPGTKAAFYDATGIQLK